MVADKHDEGLSTEGPAKREPPREPDAQDTSDRATDFRLLRAAARGDSAAFRSIVDRHQRRAQAVAFGMVRNADDALDVVQEAFVRVFRHLDEFEGQASFGTWFYRIVVNLAIDHLRKRRPRGFVEMTDEFEPGEAAADWKFRATRDPLEALERDRLAHAMQDALDTLPTYHKAVIVLREIEGMSYQEMAETLEVSKGTIMSRLFHARRKMQIRLTETLGAENVPAVHDGDEQESSADRLEKSANGVEEKRGSKRSERTGTPPNGWDTPSLATPSEGVSRSR